MKKFLVFVICLSFALAAFNLPARAEGTAAPATKTLENLMTAYNGETNAHERYLAFAVKAEDQGFGAAASLFSAAARAEQVHLEKHAAIIKKMGGTPYATIEAAEVKKTKDNLEAAYKGEVYENTVMYPEFLEQAKKDNIPDAVDAFEDTMKAEGVHAEWYKKALNELPAWKTKKKDFFVCPECGNVVDALSFANCPICGTGKEKFIPVS